MMLILLAIFFPTLCGLLLPLLEKSENRKLKLGIAVGVQVIETALGLALCFADNLTAKSFTIADKLTIGFMVDGTGKFFCALTVIGWLLVSVYSCVYMKHEGKEMKFFLFMLLSESAMLGVALSQSLISMYLFYESVTLFSMPLVLHSLSKESVRAAKKYLYYSIAGAFLALFGMFVVATNMDTLDFCPGGQGIVASPIVLAGIFTMLLGFGAKAGLFPLHGWLPSAHPVAPAPASALLSGIIAKAGVIAIIRVVFFLVGTSSIYGTWVQTAALTLSLLTVLMGSMMAYLEKGFKRRLAFSTVSQISYVLTSLFLFTDEGLVGGFWQILFHAVVKVGLFLCAGAVIYLYGKTQVADLDGMGKKMPVTFTCFTILSLSLIGIPPTGGFYSKWKIATAALDSGHIGAYSWIIPVILLISALLTAAYLLSISIKAFFGKADDDTKTVREPLLMVIPIIILTVIAVVGGILSTTTDTLLSGIIQ